MWYVLKNGVINLGKIRNEISMYLPFGKSVIQRQMSYKIGFFMRIIGGLVQVMIMYYLWVAIFNSEATGVIQGFTKNEMITYVIISYIVMQMINISIEWTISDDIRSGSIAMNLIKPINYEKRILAESLGETFKNTLTIALPVWIIFYAYQFFKQGVLPPSIGTLALFLLSLILGYIIIFLFNFIFSISSFYVTYIWGFILCKWMIINFFSGQLIPLVFFPDALKNVLNYLPFSGMSYTPVMIYLGKYSTSEAIFAIGVQAVWVVILFVLFKILWSKAIKRVAVLGG